MEMHGANKLTTMSEQELEQLYSDYVHHPDTSYSPADGFYAPEHIKEALDMLEQEIKQKYPNPGTYTPDAEDRDRAERMAILQRHPRTYRYRSSAGSIKTVSRTLRTLLSYFREQQDKKRILQYPWVLEAHRHLLNSHDVMGDPSGTRAPYRSSFT